MTYKEAADILDPETSRDALRPYDYDYQRRLQVINDACQLAAEVLRTATDANVGDKWVSVEGRNLPLNKGKSWGKYIVAITRSHFPTSSYDICDSPYDEDFVETALYDSEQKIWHIDNWDEQLNALIDIDDAPMNGDFVTHWMPLPEPPVKGE